MVVPQGALQLRIPIRSVFVDNLFQDVLKRLICRFGEPVFLRVMRGAFLVYHRIVLHEFLYHFIDKMSPLIANKLNGAFESAPNIIVPKLHR